MYAQQQQQGQSTQDAYGGYEEPPMSASYPSHHTPQQAPYPNQNANYGNTMHTIAPQPQRLHMQGVNAPSFPLDQDVTSPTNYSHSHAYTSPTGYGQAQVPMPDVERAQDMGPADAPPPMYNEHSSAGRVDSAPQHNVYPPQQHQHQQQQPSYGGNAKSGYFN